MINYQLDVASSKIIENISEVANLKLSNIRHDMTGILTLLLSYFVTTRLVNTNHQSKSFEKLWI